MGGRVRLDDNLQGDIRGQLSGRSFVPELANQIMQLPRLYTTDTKALNHILMNSQTYQKPESARFGLGRIVGPGVLVVEGEKHKQQVRTLQTWKLSERLISI